MTLPRQLWVPADRLLAVVGDRTLRDSNQSARTLREVRSGRRDYITLDSADKILVRLGLEAAWHVLREDGGLADIYEDGAQYGRPSKPRHHPPRPYTRYGDDEDARREARRLAWRESKRRLYQHLREQAA